jgi:hypothetical protein
MITEKDLKAVANRLDLSISGVKVLVSSLSGRLKGSGNLYLSSSLTVDRTISISEILADLADLKTRVLALEQKVA